MEQLSIHPIAAAARRVNVTAWLLKLLRCDAARWRAPVGSKVLLIFMCYL